MLRWAVKEYNGPVAVRYPRGGDGEYADCGWNAQSTVLTHRSGKDAAIITYGTLVNNALLAADILSEQGIEISVIRLTQLNPIHFDELESALNGIQNVIFAEEACAGIRDVIAGGLPNHHIVCVDLRGEFVTHGSIARLYQQYGLDGESIAQKVKEVLENEN